MISLSLTATFQVDNLAELWNKGICVVKEGVTTTQTSLMAAGKLITAVMLNQEGALLLPGRGVKYIFVHLFAYICAQFRSSCTKMCATSSFSRSTKKCFGSKIGRLKTSTLVSFYILHFNTDYIPILTQAIFQKISNRTGTESPK